MALIEVHVDGGPMLQRLMRAVERIADALEFSGSGGNSFTSRRTDIDVDESGLFETDHELMEKMERARSEYQFRTGKILEEGENPPPHYVPKQE